MGWVDQNGPIVKRPDHKPLCAAVREVPVGDDGFAGLRDDGRELTNLDCVTWSRRGRRGRTWRFSAWSGRWRTRSGQKRDDGYDREEPKHTVPHVRSFQHAKWPRHLDLSMTQCAGQVVLAVEQQVEDGGSVPAGGDPERVGGRPRPVSGRTRPNPRR